jgi:hypothetical protein
MDADAEQQLLVFRHVPVFVPEPALNFDGHLDAPTTLPNSARMASPA